VNLRSAKLTNYEVMRFLQDQRESIQKVNKKEKRKNPNKKVLLTVTLETLSWLETQPGKVQTEENVTAFCEKLAQFCQENQDSEGQNIRLSKNEVIQLINHRPTSAVEIQFLIENSEERLSEDQVESLLQLVTECLPSHCENDEEDHEEEEDVEDDTGPKD